MNTAQLTEKYKELQWKLHPDKFSDVSEVCAYCVKLGPFHVSNAQPMGLIGCHEHTGGFIHLIPKWRPINYSFACMLISPLRLVYMYRKQKNFEVKMRRRGLTKMQTKE